MEQIKCNKSESKYYNTACLMDEALLILLERKPFEYITVKEVCEKAGVNRSTFYLHYESMNDLISECLEYVTKNLKCRFLEEDKIEKKEISGCSKDELFLFSSKYLIPYLEFVKDNKPLFFAVASQPAVFNVTSTFDKMYSDIFEPIMNRFDIPEREKKYRVTFFINGIHSVISQWIKNGFIEETHQIADLIQDCIPVRKENLLKEERK